jgi:glycosyltransferase involved in cell wall biosynthesis
MPEPRWPGLPNVVRLPHRPDRRKGHVSAIDGLARALPDSLETRLEIAWLDEERYAAYRSELEQLAERQGVADQVVFTSWLDGDVRWESAARANATLLTGGFAETFGLAVIESILAGRPAVTTFQPAINEVVGATELHLQLDDPRDWYFELARFWKRLDGRATSELRPRALAGAMSLDRMAAGYDRLLDSAMRHD